MKRIVWALLLLGTALMFGCTFQKSEEYVFLAGSSSVFDQEVGEGFLAEMESLGLKASIELPKEMTISRQYQCMEDILIRKPEGIAVIPNSSGALNEIIHQYHEKSIPVIGLNNSLLSEDISMQIFPAPTERTAKELLAYAAEYMDGKGQFAVLSTTNQETDNELIIQVIRSELEAGSYPGLLLTEVAYGNKDKLRCKNKTEHLLKTYPNLKMILALSPEATQGACEVLSETEGEARNQNSTGRQVEIAGMYCVDEDESVPEGLAFYYTYDLQKLGRLAAAALYGLQAQEEGCQEGMTLELEGLGTYEIKRYKGMYLTGEEQEKEYPCIYMEEGVQWIFNFEKNKII